MDFPDFMLREQNRVPAWQQNTPGIEGYYYTGGDGSQMAFWTYTEDRVSKEHRHDYDEYMLCVEGEYVVTIDGVEHTLHAGDELFIPKGSLQGGRVKAGTRSIHAFGGQRVVPYEMVSYTDGMKDAVFDFLTKAFIDAGKCFEPGARHGIYNDIPRNFDLFLCMMDGGAVVGTVAVKKLGGGDCELKALYLLKEYQGKKLGYALASAAISFARGKGYRKMFLDSMKGYDRALRLYRSLGFAETERYNDNDRADVFMALDLAR